MFCAQCGKKIKDDAKFCGFCGHQVRKVGAGTAVPAAPPVRRDAPVVPVPVATAPVATAPVTTTPVAPVPVPTARRDTPTEMMSRPLPSGDVSVPAGSSVPAKPSVPGPIAGSAPVPVSGAEPADKTGVAENPVPVTETVPGEQTTVALSVDKTGPVSSPTAAAAPAVQSPSSSSSPFPSPQGGASMPSSGSAALPEPSVKPPVAPNDMRNFLIGSAVVVAVFGLCTVGAVTYRLGVWGGAKASGPEPSDAQVMTIDADSLGGLPDYLR